MRDGTLQTSVHVGIGRFLAFAYMFLSFVGQCNAQSVTNIFDGVVYVRLTTADGRLFREGSGVLLGSDGFIFTAKHLFDNFDATTGKVSVSLRGVKTALIPASRYPADASTTDIALLYVNQTEVRNAGIGTYFRLGCNTPPIMESIIVAGFPAGDASPLLVLPAVVTTDSLDSSFRDYMRAGIAPGMSGGPIFWRGYLIGLVYGAADNVEAFTPINQSGELRTVAKVDCYQVPPNGPVQVAILSADPKGPVPIGDVQKPAQAPASAKPRVFVQIAAESQRADATKLISGLVDKGINAARGIENVGSKAPLSGEIRYFSAEDRANADKIKAILDQLSPTTFSIQRENVPNSPQNVFELWYPHG
ncbi:S1 family peptidase [Mesorhizobium sophorae]|uniref:S1 family peptidase n=1 Tax=Mesorhizobium sophorae TaxID=1300294 RepID=UPI000BA36277|nr:serine protease [Mesorhizobium sophorae]